MLVPNVSKSLLAITYAARADALSASGSIIATALRPGFFENDSMRTPLTDIRFQPIHPGMFPDIKDNVDEKMPEIYGNRKSNLLELNNFKLNLIVPGRTDVEVGRTLDFIFPDVSPKSEKDKNKFVGDKFYTGSYLITAIRHKVTLQSHHMIIEIFIDSINDARENS